MPSFRYTGRNAQGAKVSGELEGASADSVAGELLSRQITPLTIDASDAGAAGRRPASAATNPASRTPRPAGTCVITPATAAISSAPSTTG